MSNSFAISTAGRIATQPILKYGDVGRPRVHFRLAIDDNARNADGEWVKRQTVFHDVVAFGKSAERYAATLTVGDPVVVAGDLRFSTYDKDGEERTASQIVATAVGPDLRMCDVTIDRNHRRPAPDQNVGVSGPAAISGDGHAPTQRASATGPAGRRALRWPDRLRPSRPVTDL